MSNQNRNDEGRKRCATANDNRRIKRMCLDNRRKLSGCTQGEIVQINVMLSVRNVWHRLEGFGLNVRMSLK